MNQSLAKFLFLGIERLRGEPVERFLREMEAVQWRPPDEIRTAQASRLNDLLSFTVANNPYYQKKYRGLPEDVPFHELPLLTKQELRQHARSMVTPGRERTVTLCKTSGSTGEPLRFYRDSSVFGRTLASVYRGQRWHGLDIGSSMAMLWGIPPARGDRIRMRVRDWALNRFREQACDLTPEVLASFLRDIVRRKPAFIFGYPSMVYEFALFCRSRSDFHGQALGLRAAICTAESIHPHQRQMIEDVFGCPVVSEYGSAETGIISYQCAEGHHHVSDDVVLVELLDDEDRLVPDGTVGKVVVTVLFSHAAPLIRYELGDLAVRKEGTCACGVNLSLLSDIVGRTTGIIFTPAGKSLHSSIFSYIMKDYVLRFGGVRQFLVRQTELDHIEFHLVTEAGLSAAARSWLLTTLQGILGRDIRITLHLPEEIARAPSGKFSSFQSDLAPGGGPQLTSLGHSDFRPGPPSS